MRNPETPTLSEFTHSLTKISVSRILKSTGFKSSKSSALDALTRITSLFLHHLTTSAASRIRTAFFPENPTLNDVVSAIQLLNSPLDFSIPQLTRFITDSTPLPLPSHVPKPVIPPITAAECFSGCDLKRKRGPEVPSWLPAFPQIAMDNKKYSGNDNTEVYWEERWRERERKSEREGCVVPTLVAKETRVKRMKGVMMRDVMMYGRRERLKFRFRVNRKVKDGNMNNLEMRNGVCRGGKRICSVNCLDCIRFFQDDDDRE